MPDTYEECFDKKLEAAYENYELENIGEIKNSFVDFLINIAAGCTGTSNISSECFTLINDLRTIFGEIISNSLLHGVHPIYQLRKTDTKIIIKVINKRIEGESGVHQNCGRGMTFIKGLIMAHRDIKITHSHAEDADTYRAYLVISLDDFTNYVKQYYTPQA